MNSELLTLLTALQYGESFFPSGAIAFSWGLEALCADGEIASAEAMARFLEGQVRCRWASSDRVFHVAAHRAGDNLAAVIHADRLQEAMALPRELREGSHRAGMALLSVHTKLGTPNGAAYREHVLNGKAPGHLAPVQGLVWRGVGLGLSASCAMSAHVFAMGLLSAALRLGLIGHLDGQRILAQLRPQILSILAEPVPDLDEAATYSLATDIAMMRHETQEGRLFSN